MTGFSSSVVTDYYCTTPGTHINFRLPKPCEKAHTNVIKPFIYIEDLFFFRRPELKVSWKRVSVNYRYTESVTNEFPKFELKLI